MEILTFNRWTAQEFTSNKPYIVISITEPGVIANIPNCKGLTGILRVQFHDIDRMMEGCKRIDSYQADEIATFVKHQIDSIDFIVVHCEAGVSRSAGVSMAIMDWLKYKGIEVEKKQYPCANRLVYRAVYRALMKGEE